MKKITSTFMFFAAFAVAVFFAAPSHAAARAPLPLVIENETGSEIISVSIAQTGTDKWSRNLLPQQIQNGSELSFDIARDEILGLCEVKITLRDGRSIIWHRLPILEIFTIKVDKNLVPHYDRIKPSS